MTPASESAIIDVGVITIGDDGVGCSYPRFHMGSRPLCTPAITTGSHDRRIKKELVRPQPVAASPDGRAMALSTKRYAALVHRSSSGTRPRWISMPCHEASRSRLPHRHARRSRVAGSAASPHPGHGRRRSALCVAWRQPRRGPACAAIGFSDPRNPVMKRPAPAMPHPTDRVAHEWERSTYGSTIDRTDSASVPDQVISDLDVEVDVPDRPATHITQRQPPDTGQTSTEKSVITEIRAVTVRTHIRRFVRRRLHARDPSRWAGTRKVAGRTDGTIWRCGGPLQWPPRRRVGSVALVNPCLRRGD